jgi:hypothetical protein
MKRLAISLVFGIMLMGTALLNAQELYGVIQECSGNVEVKSSGNDWMPAQAGMRMQSSDLISTGFKSTAILVVGNSAILIRPLTRLSLEALAARNGEEQINLFLRAGHIRASVNPPPNTKTVFTVKSPMATASVRGTSFDFDAFNLRVLSGMVAFMGSDNVTVFAGADQKAGLNSQGRSSVPVSDEGGKLAQIGPPPASGPVHPVAAGPGGVLIVPGAIGGYSPSLTPSATGGAEIDTQWQ